MTSDDLPPPQNHREDDTIWGQIGDLFGQGIWIVLFLAIAGGLFYFLARAIH